MNRRFGAGLLHLPGPLVAMVICSLMSLSSELLAEDKTGDGGGLLPRFSVLTADAITIKTLMDAMQVDEASAFLECARLVLEGGEPGRAMHLYDRSLARWPDDPKTQAVATRGKYRCYTALLPQEGQNGLRWLRSERDQLLELWTERKADADARGASRAWNHLISLLTYMGELNQAISELRDYYSHPEIVFWHGLPGDRDSAVRQIERVYLPHYEAAICARAGSFARAMDLTRSVEAALACLPADEQRKFRETRLPIARRNCEAGLAVRDLLEAWKAGTISGIGALVGHTAQDAGSVEAILETCVQNGIRPTGWNLQLMWPAIGEVGARVVGEVQFEKEPPILARSGTWLFDVVQVGERWRVTRMESAPYLPRAPGHW